MELGGTGKRESDTEEDWEALQCIGMKWNRLGGNWEAQGRQLGTLDSSYKAVPRVVTVILPPPGDWAILVHSSTYWWCQLRTPLIRMTGRAGQVDIRVVGDHLAVTNPEHITQAAEVGGRRLPPAPGGQSDWMDHRVHPGVRPPNLCAAPVQIPSTEPVQV